MKTKHSRSYVLAPALALAAALSQSVQAQHGHLNVGADGAAQGDPLMWANGADFIDASGYVKTLEFAATGRYAGYYQGGITLTALPATPAHAGPDPDAPAVGSYIHFQMACLEGPADGAFQFWDSTGTAPAESLAPGENGTNFWVLSENEGAAGTDPYGHIHGRRFTATRPGVYRIAFTAFDLSGNGTGGGPIHTPSESLTVAFQAGVIVMDVAPDVAADRVRVRFGAQAGYRWQLHASPEIGGMADWQPVGEPVVGEDLVVERNDDRPPGQGRFYRLVGTPVIP